VRSFVADQVFFCTSESDACLAWTRVSGQRHKPAIHRVEKAMSADFIGTNSIGNPVAMNLLQAGHNLFIHDIQANAYQNLEDRGAQNDQKGLLLM
jgi:hypothetical protein